MKSFLIFTAQSVFSGDFFRQLLRQCCYILVLNSPRLNTQLSRLSRQIFRDPEFVQSASEDLDDRFCPLLVMRDYVLLCNTIFSNFLDRP